MLEDIIQNTSKNRKKKKHSKLASKDLRMAFGVGIS